MVLLFVLLPKASSMFHNVYFSRVMTLREHTRWIVKVHLQHGAEGKILSARYKLQFSSIFRHLTYLS